jgi:hypothetical protein
MSVDETYIWTGGEYTFNIFNEGRDHGFHMCGDRINSLAIAYVSRESAYDAILGCQDKKIRIMQDSNPIMESIADAAVSEVHVRNCFVILLYIILSFVY